MAKEKGRKAKRIEQNEVKIIENNLDFEHEKEEKLLNLLVEIIVKTTLKEFYETCDQVSEI